MSPKSTPDPAPTADSRPAAASADEVREPRDGDPPRRTSLSFFFLIMCTFRDAIFITGPILVFRLDSSVKSGGIYGSALLFGGMFSFLVSGALLDRLGWKRVSLAAAGTLAIANGLLAATALGLLPYQQEIDIAILLVIFICGTVFYLVPDILINRLLPEAAHPDAYAQSGSLFPAVALMIMSSLLFGVERVLGTDALGLTMGLTGLLAALGVLLIYRLPEGQARDVASAQGQAKRGVASVLGEWLSGFRFVASESIMRLLLIFNCCLAIALAPHNVFVTAILKSSFALDDGGVAVARFALASVQVLAAIAFPLVARSSSMRTLALVSVAALTLGNGIGAVVLFRRESTVDPSNILLFIYIAAHVIVFVGFTFSSAWIRMVRGRSTPVNLLGRTVGAMSTAAQLFGLLFSLFVSFAGASIATHAFYIFCVATIVFVGAPAAIGVAKRLALR